MREIAAIAALLLCGSAHAATLAFSDASSDSTAPAELAATLSYSLPSVSTLELSLRNDTTGSASFDISSLYFNTFPDLLYILILRNTGQIDWPVVGSSYIGVLGIGAGYLAVGLLMSALTRSQLMALVLTILVQFGLFILGIGEYIFEPGLLREICSHVSVLSQMDDFSKGIVDLRRLTFDMTLVMLPLFLTGRVVDSWRWD